SWFSCLCNAQSDFVSRERIVWVDIEGVPLHAWSRSTFNKIRSIWGEVMELEECKDDFFALKRICIKTKQEDNIIEKFKIIIHGKIFVLRAKELFVWSTVFKDPLNEKETSNDPFNIYDLLKKHDKGEEVKGTDQAKSQIRFEGLCSRSKAKKEWIRELNIKHKVNFLTLQETKMDSISAMDVKLLWGNYNFDHVFSEAVGNSGGILCTWDSNVFHKEQHIILNNFVALYGTWNPNKAKLLMISIYAPPSATGKRSLWSYITSLITRWNGDCMVMGDLNEVRCMEDRMGVNDEILLSRMDLLKQMQDIKSFDARDCMQKAKIQWAIEGDENSKFFHGIINRKRANLAIKGVMVDGEWIDDPSRVKEEFCSHFATRFQAPGVNRSRLNFRFPNRLNPDQVAELENPITRDEIRNAVWACGENKSPGPDVFNFEFFRKLWNIIGSDLCVAFEWFFDHSSF
nr:RNA-directed DNA polymerase, eukaryota [Tanacetum cinerariifolium]